MSARLSAPTASAVARAAPNPHIHKPVKPAGSRSRSKTPSHRHSTEKANEVGLATIPEGKRSRSRVAIRARVASEATASLPAAIAPTSTTATVRSVRFGSIATDSPSSSPSAVIRASTLPSPLRPSLSSVEPITSTAGVSSSVTLSASSSAYAPAALSTSTSTITTSTLSNSSSLASGPFALNEPDELDELERLVTSFDNIILSNHHATAASSDAVALASLSPPVVDAPPSSAVLITTTTAAITPSPPFSLATASITSVALASLSSSGAAIIPSPTPSSAAASTSSEGAVNPLPPAVAAPPSSAVVTTTAAAIVVAVIPPTPPSSPSSSMPAHPLPAVTAAAPPLSTSSAAASPSPFSPPGSPIASPTASATHTPPTPPSSPSSSTPASTLLPASAAVNSAAVAGSRPSRSISTILMSLPFHIRYARNYAYIVVYGPEEESRLFQEITSYDTLRKEITERLNENKKEEEELKRRKSLNDNQISYYKHLLSVRRNSALESTPASPASPQAGSTAAATIVTVASSPLTSSSMDQYSESEIINRGEIRAGILGDLGKNAALTKGLQETLQATRDKKAALTLQLRELQEAIKYARLTPEERQLADKEKERKGKMKKLVQKIDGYKLDAGAKTELRQLRMSVTAIMAADGSSSSSLQTRASPAAQASSRSSQAEDGTS